MAFAKHDSTMPAVAGRRQRDRLIIIFLAAAAIRFFFLVRVFDYHAHFPKYIELARRFLGELQPPIEVFYSSPFYVLLIAFLRSVFSCGPEQIKCIQALTGSLNVVLIYLAGREFFSRKTALVAAGLASLYGPLILHDCSLLSETYVITFNLAGMLLLARFVRTGSRRSAALAGLCLGLGLATRPNMSIFAILVAVGLCFRVTGRLRFSIPLFLAAVMVPTLPIAALNYLRSGEAVWLSNSGGWVMYCSNNRDSSGLGFYPPHEVMTIGVKNYLTMRKGIGYTEHLDSIMLARQRTGRLLSHKEVSRYWFSQGVAEIAAEPSRFLGLAARKCFYAVNQFEAHDTIETVRDSWRMAAVPLISFGMVMPLAVLGLIYCRRADCREAWMLHVYLASNLLFLAIFYVIPRFRLPAEPVLLLFAAQALVVIVRMVRERHARVLAAMAVVIGLAAPAVHLSDRTIRLHRDIAVPNAVRLSEGTHLMKTGHIAEAIALFKKNIELNPQDTAAHYCLGLAYRLLGDRANSQKELGPVAESAPDNASHK